MIVLAVAALKVKSSLKVIDVGINVRAPAPAPSLPAVVASPMVNVSMLKNRASSALLRSPESEKFSLTATPPDSTTSVNDRLPPPASIVPGVPPVLREKSA